MTAIFSSMLLACCSSHAADVCGDRDKVSAVYSRVPGTYSTM